MNSLSYVIPIVILLVLFGSIHLVVGESAKQIAEKCEGGYNSCRSNATVTRDKCLNDLEKEIGGCAGPNAFANKDLPGECGQQASDFESRKITCTSRWDAEVDVCSSERNKCYNDPGLEGDPNVDTVKGLSGDALNQDCSVNQEVFDRDWEIYSDLYTEPDDFSPLTSRSLEAQKYFNTKSKIRDTKKEIILIKRDLEIGRLMRVELRNYREALIKNLKTNLVKAFIRLAYITYDIVKGTPGLGGGAVGTGKTFMKLFDTEVHKISKIGAALKVLIALTPKDSVFAINTDNITGKVNSVVLTGQLDTLDSLFDAKEIGKGIVQEIVKQNLPSPDITEEEIGILKNQHLNKRVLDDIIQESYRINFEDRDKVKELEAEIGNLKKQTDEWKGKEKQRVMSKLQRACRGET